MQHCSLIVRVILVFIDRQKVHVDCLYFLDFTVVFTNINFRGHQFCKKQSFWVRKFVNSFLFQYKLLTFFFFTSMNVWFSGSLQNRNLQKIDVKRVLTTIYKIIFAHAWVFFRSVFNSPRQSSVIDTLSYWHRYLKFVSNIRRVWNSSADKEGARGYNLY